MTIYSESMIMARRPDFMVTALATTNCSGCVLTPDGQSLIFTTGHEVRRVPVGGGASVQIAGRMGEGGEDGLVTTPARFRWPRGVVIREDGSIFVADDGNHRIRMISPAGAVTTFAGSGEEGGADGVGIAASFRYPSGLTLGPGGVLYVSESHRVRMISPAGAVTTLAGNRVQGFADGRGTEASFNYPTGIAVDAKGVVFVADSENHCIRRITNGVVDTLAGNGTFGSRDGVNAAARFNHPRGIAFDPTTGNLLVTDVGNHRIRSVDPRSGAVSTLPIGGGAAPRPPIGAPPSDAAGLNLTSLSAITVDRNGTLYLGMYGGIVRIDNVRRIREHGRDSRNALLAGLLPDPRRPLDEKRAEADAPIDPDRAVNRVRESGVLTAGVGPFLSGVEPVSGQTQDMRSVLGFLGDQHTGRIPMGSRFTAPPRPLPAAAPPSGGRSRKTRRRMKNPCWKGYTAYGMKKGGPNCVPIKSRRQRRRE